jgi:iron-sulfur cluster repair protein YtfE (RIC family)
VRLSGLVSELGEVLRTNDVAADPKVRALLSAQLIELRDELLDHFANEEEGLFPFVRNHLRTHLQVIDRLEAAHDSICGAIVRLVHLAMSERGTTRDMLALFERFEDTHATHSRAEAELLEELSRTLTQDDDRELAEQLRGLA